MNPIADKMSPIGDKTIPINARIIPIGDKAYPINADTHPSGTKMHLIGEVLLKLVWQDESVFSYICQAQNLNLSRMSELAKKLNAEAKRNRIKKR